jgi:hypothetical protein
VQAELVIRGLAERRIHTVAHSTFSFAFYSNSFEGTPVGMPLCSNDIYALQFWAWERHSKFIALSESGWRISAGDERVPVNGKQFGYRME